MPAKEHQEVPNGLHVHARASARLPLSDWDLELALRGSGLGHAHVFYDAHIGMADESVLDVAESRTPDMVGRVGVAVLS